MEQTVERGELGSGVQIEVWDVKGRGMFISYGWSEKRNREGTNVVVERREMEIFHIKGQFQHNRTKVVYLWESGEGRR